jgi:hypothetical protein
MATYKQIVWSVIMITSWLSLIASIWLTEFGFITFWNIIFWAIMLLLIAVIGLDRKK